MELMSKSVLVCNKNHGMLNLSLYVTLFVVIIMCNFNYIMTPSLILVKQFGKFHLLLPLSMISYPKFYVEEKIMNYFTKRNVLVVKKCDHCGNLTLFHNKCPIDINDQSLSNIKVKWKRYEYIHTSIGSSSVQVLEGLVYKKNKTF